MTYYVCTYKYKIVEIFNLYSAWCKQQRIFLFHPKAVVNRTFFPISYIHGKPVKLIWYSGLKVFKVKIMIKQISLFSTLKISQFLFLALFGNILKFFSTIHPTEPPPPPPSLSHSTWPPNRLTWTAASERRAPPPFSSTSNGRALYRQWGPPERPALIGPRYWLHADTPQPTRGRLLAQRSGFFASFFL